MLLAALAETSRQVAQTAARLDKIKLLAELLERLEPDEIELALGFLSGWPRQGRLGLGWASLSRAESVEAATTPSLSLGDVDRFFDDITKAKGKGAGAGRLNLLSDLFGKATADERRFLAALVMGEVRQGALEGILIEAVARAGRVEAKRLRRAVMLAGDLNVVARALLVDGEAALELHRLELFKPIQPMLADSADNLTEALNLLGRAALEYKLDGARIQVHKGGNQVRIFTRSLNEVTSAVPEVVEFVAALPADRMILDGEVLAMNASGRPEPFQITMKRFGRRLDVDRLRAELPVAAYFFDLLLLDDEELLDRPQLERFERLTRVVPPEARVPNLITADPVAAAEFLRHALDAGHEGVMAKALGAPYDAGRRGKGWLKVKEARTLDLVVLAVEWGSGRRTGWLSNIHLGARDAGGAGFVMLGKTFKGMTDEMLASQTAEFLAREVSREGHVVHVRPEVVVEVAFNDIQESPHYPGGLALRFARVKRYRPDKTAELADTIETVRDIYRKQTGREPPAGRPTLGSP